MKTSFMKAFLQQRLLRFGGALLLVSLLTLVGTTPTPRARASSSPDPAALVLTASAPGAPVYGSVTLTVTATDAADKPVSGVDVQFFSSSLKNQPAQNTVATDANGQATLASTDKVGEPVTDLVAATFTDALTKQTLASNLVPVQWADESFITLRLSGSTQTGPLVLTATVIGLDGITPLAGVTVSFYVFDLTALLGTAATDDAGQASITLTAENVPGFRATFSRTVNGKTTTLYSNVATLPGAFKATLTPSMSLAPVFGSVTLTATLTDAAGNPVSETGVLFIGDSGPNAGENFLTVTNAQGQATFTFTDTKGNLPPIACG